MLATNAPPQTNLLNFSELPSQPPINGKAVRIGRSLNWVQYLFLFLRIRDHIDSALLLPWVSVYQNSLSLKQKVSVDYAFASALSSDACADDSYFPAPIGLCGEQNVYAAQNDYRQHPDQEIMREKVLIPGVQKQIEFFRQDLAAKKVYADDNTLYVIWTGANDLSLNFRALLQGNFSLFLKNVNATIPEMTVQAILQLQMLGAKNIIVIGQQNLGLTPEANLLTNGSHYFVTRYLSAYILNALILKYNIALTRQISIFRDQHPDVRISYVPLQSLFNRLSLLPGAPFYHTLGLACQSKNAKTYHDITQGKIIDCHNYLYWNRSHMTNPANQMIAKAVLEHLWDP